MQMLQFVLGNLGFGGGVETAEDGDGNCAAVLVQGRRLSGDLLKVLLTFRRVQRDLRTLE